ncbi:hypothetical protein A9179_09500 [Pseudomonas alcaligenes]|uniref:RiboL-PSP-HEPN domain-containing protein n=2 Tax=Aquipseudomonas alcaligenes TaxID=43263 RepID=A0ABR7RYX5_AQUAC|nr:hypothetical protein [Pseudomonas alcaligenes]
MHRGFRTSVQLLMSYLQDMGDAIKKIQKQHEEIVGKLEAAKSGVPDPSPPNLGEKTIQLDLNDEQIKLLTDVMKSAQSQKSSYPNLTFRMSFVYLVATFDAFIADVFLEVARARPEILKTSKKQLPYDRLLEFQSLDELVSFIASRELNELGYKSIKDQSDYYQDRFGVALQDSGILLAELTELRAARNLLVHNNGLVNHIYLEQVSGSKYKAGDNVQVDSDYFNRAVKSFQAVASFVTAKLIEKHAAKLPSGAA